MRHDSKKGAQGTKRARVHAKRARVHAKRVRQRFGRAYVRRMCFIRQVRLGGS